MLSVVVAPGKKRFHWVGAITSSGSENTTKRNWRKKTVTREQLLHEYSIYNQNLEADAVLEERCKDNLTSNGCFARLSDNTAAITRIRSVMLPAQHAPEGEWWANRRVVIVQGRVVILYNAR